MSTGTSIIHDALKRIGAYSIAQPAAPETISDALEILNSMIQTWRSKSIFLDLVPLKVEGSNLSEPLDARNAIVDNLALMLAPNFEDGKAVVSPQLKANAKAGLIDITRLYRKNTIPNKVPSATLPRGAGNDYGSGNDKFFRKGSALSD
jgi:hypothetical protein